MSINFKNSGKNQQYYLPFTRMSRWEMILGKEIWLLIRNRDGLTAIMKSLEGTDSNNIQSLASIILAEPILKEYIKINYVESCSRPRKVGFYIRFDRG